MDLLFAEIFPINIDKLPQLYTYKLALIGNNPPNEIGRKLHYQLASEFGGSWNWDVNQQCIVSNMSILEPDLTAFLSKLWQIDSDVFKQSLEAISPVFDLLPSTQGIADFVAQSLLESKANNIKKVLQTFNQNRGIYTIKLQCSRFGYIVDGKPSISTAIRSTLDYKGDLNSFIAQNPNDKLIGLHVTDKTKPFETAMEITNIIGPIGEGGRRQRLLGYNLSTSMREIIEKSPNDELVVQVKKYQYVTSALGIKIFTADYARFNVREKLQISSSDRIDYVQPIAEVLQETGFIGKAYNSSRNENLFLPSNNINYKPVFKFARGIQQMTGFKGMLSTIHRLGVYQPANEQKIRIAILNAFPQLKLEELKNALRTWLQDNLKFQLVKTTEDIIIPNLRRVELEKAIKEISKNPPHIILAILPENYSDSDSEEWTPYDDFKYITLTQGLNSQVIYPKTVGNKYAIDNIVLGILAKTGNVPYIFNDPISYADMVVGLDVSRYRKSNQTGTINMAASARIYLNTGELLRYSVQGDIVEGETISPHILKAIFPLDEFAGKKVIIHRDGRMPEAEYTSLTNWGREIGCEFMIVEIIKGGNPRLYKQKGKDTVKSPKGSIMKLNENEALLVTSEYPDTFKATPQPLRICIQSNNISLENALHSVLMLTHLHYSSERPPRLPVTTFYADKLSGMVAKGLAPQKMNGKIPFWL